MSELKVKRTNLSNAQQKEAVQDKSSKQWIPNKW